MLSPAHPAPHFPRVEQSGALRVLPDVARGRTSSEISWGGVRALEFEMIPEEVPQGHLLNHLVTLNLGQEITSEWNFDGRGWQTHRTPRHGVGVFPALLPYSARMHSRGKFLMVEIDPEFVSAVVGPEASKLALQPMVSVQDNFAMHVMLALAEETKRGVAPTRLRGESLGTALVSHLIERGTIAPPSNQVGSLASPLLRRVLEYVSENIDSPLTLRTLAGLAEMDVFRFIRAFKQSTGLSPHRYVLESRINKAKELLADREMSITDIALETGFATPSHFSVTFRRIANETPRAYRDRVTGGRV